MPIPSRMGIKDEERLLKEPVEMPVGYGVPTPLEDLIARMVKDAVADERQDDDDFETIQEANDFDWPGIDEELINFTPYDLAESHEAIPEEPTSLTEENIELQPMEAPQEEEESDPASSTVQDSETPS